MFWSQINRHAFFLVCKTFNKQKLLADVNKYFFSEQIQKSPVMIQNMWR